MSSQPSLFIIYGTRPEYIKLRSIVRSLKDNFSDRIQTILCCTGQHVELLSPYVANDDMITDFNLQIVRTGQELGELTAKIILSVSNILSRIKPDAVAVIGDTTSCFGSALAAFYLKIPVIHFEAGLRSHNIFEPFPEEANRIMISRISAMNYVTTRTAFENLKDEGVASEHIYLAGNTLEDSLFEYIEYLTGVQAGSGSRRILVTQHRRESIPDGIIGCCQACLELLAKMKDSTITFVVHPNTQIKEIVYQLLGSHDRVNLIESLPHPEFLKLLVSSDLVLTDSGGVTEECALFRIPTVILRDTIERNNLLHSDSMKVVGTNKSRIVSAATELLAAFDTSEGKSVHIEYKNYGGAIAEHVVSLFEGQKLEQQ